MRILVTGAAGFIGSHVCDALLERGDTVVGLDNFDPFYPRDFKERNLSAVKAMARGRFTMVEGDIRDAAALDQAFDSNLNAVVHLAALAGVRPSIEVPLRYEDVNIMGVTQVLEAMRRHQVRRLVFASSSSVYGNSKRIPFSEDDPADNPISPYAASKRSGELIVHTYSHLFGVAADCLRFFTVYGPRQRPDLAIWKFTDLIQRGKPVPVFGDGEMSRDFTYIGDIVKGVLASLDSLSGYRVFNLGGNRTVSVNQLLELLGKILGKEVVRDRLPCQPGDVEKTCADIKRAGEILGYNPKTPIELGLEKFSAWFLRECQAEKQG